MHILIDILADRFHYEGNLNIAVLTQVIISKSLKKNEPSIFILSPLLQGSTQREIFKISNKTANLTSQCQLSRKFQPKIKIKTLSSMYISVFIFYCECVRLLPLPPFPVASKGKT